MAVPISDSAVAVRMYELLREAVAPGEDYAVALALLDAMIEDLGHVRPMDGEELMERSREAIEAGLAFREAIVAVASTPCA
jgi:hypothetical protein